MSKKVLGSVMVVGGGIAGIQASLDLANSGYYVHLVEKGPAIGGKMAQLSDTFPTLDCSQCMMTPRTAEVNAHPNIRMLMCSTVESIVTSRPNCSPSRRWLGADTVVTTASGPL